jgi:hypothetical protein
MYISIIKDNKGKKMKIYKPEVKLVIHSNDEIQLIAGVMKKRNGFVRVRGIAAGKVTDKLYKFMIGNADSIGSTHWSDCQVIRISSDNVRIGKC